MERALHGDFALVKAWKGDALGNLVYRKTARNFNPLAAAAARVTIAEVEELVGVGDLDGDQINTPGIYVQRVVHGTTYEKPIERLVELRRSGRRLSGWAADLVVERDCCNECEQAAGDAGSDAVQRSAPCRSRIKISFAVQKMLSIRWRVGARWGALPFCRAERTLLGACPAPPTPPYRPQSELCAAGDRHPSVCDIGTFKMTPRHIDGLHLTWRALRSAQKTAGLFE